MKLYLIFSLAILISLPFNVTPSIQIDLVDDWKWSSTEVISTESTLSSGLPSIAVDSADNIHVIWEDTSDYNGAGTDKDIFYKRWNGTWSPTEVISTESTSNSFSVSIAVDNADNIHVTRYDNTDYDGAGTDADIFYKFWNGTSWNSTEVISTESTLASRNPSIAVDSADNIHVTWDDTTDYNGAGTDSDIFYKFWNGTSWSSTEVISTESTLNSVRPSIAVDSADNIHVTWDDTTDYNGAGTDSDVFYKRWTGIWSSTEVISTESTSFSASPSIAVDSADNIHVVYYDSTDYNGAGGDVDIFYKSWTGTSWSSTEVISTESTSDSLVPSIAVDSADNIHIAWHDNTNYNGAGTENDIFYKFWDGAWSPVEVISTESTSDSSDPIIVIDSADFIHVIWHDQTDYNGAGTDFDIFYKVLSGPPEIPVLNPIVPNPNGIVDLNWAETYATSSYSVYRDVYPIHSIEGLTPIAETELYLQPII